MDEVFVVSRNKLLRKGGPYVGPRGGLWADPQHTKHWEPVTAQPHDFGHVESEKVDQKVEELAKLTLDELKALKDRNTQLKQEQSTSKTGVSVDLLRWGRIIDKAIAKHPPKMVAVVATPPAEVQAAKREEPVTPGVIVAPTPEKPAEPVAPPPKPTEIVDDFGDSLDKKIEQESKPVQKKERKPRKPKAGMAKIEATGDHIWGSRVDLARLEGGITDSKQLETMNYDDAVKLVTKKHLVPAHSLETLKATGMSPGTAHMVLALTSAIGAKPGDSTAERAAYVDEVHSLLGAMLNCKTLDDFNVMLREMQQRRHSSSRYEVVEEMPLTASYEDIMGRIAQLKRDNPGVEYYRQRSFSSTEPPKIIKDAARPYDAMGPRFVAFVMNRRDSKLFNEAYTEALTADNKWDFAQGGQTIKDGWEYLAARGSKKAEAAKAKQAKQTARGKTERGWSGAKEVRGDVVRTGATVEVKDADPKRVKTTFGLKEVDYGQEGYMTQADREYHTKALEGALHDFAEILGIPPTALSLKGRLGVAMGARGRGKALAHYEPGRYVINLTKFNGGGSLAHEWGHALDNIIAHVYRGDKERGQFLSQAPEASHWPEELKAAYRKVHEAMNKHPDPLKARNEHNALVAKLREARNEVVNKNNTLVREYETIKKKSPPDRVAGQIAVREKNIANWTKEIEELKAKQKERRAAARDSEIANRDFWIKKQQGEIAKYKAGELTRTEADDKRLAEIEGAIEELRPEINRATDKLKQMEKLDPTVSNYRRSAVALGAYWSSPEEMFARAFESHVQDKLKRNGRANTYLVDGTSTRYPTIEELPNGETIQPYPHDKERENISKAMDEFIATLSKLDQFQKALRNSLPFTRFTIPVQL